MPDTEASLERLAAELEEAAEHAGTSGGAPGLAAPPVRRLGVLACMDARLPIDRILGLAPGDAHVVRNAGGRVDPGVVRSLVVSNAVLGTRAFVVVHHTGCGMHGLDQAAFRERWPGAADVELLGYTDEEGAVREDCAALASALRDRGLEVDGVLGYLADTATWRLRRIV